VALTLVYRDREHEVEAVDRQRVKVDGELYDVRRAPDGAVRISKARPTDAHELRGDTAWVAANGRVRWVFLNGQVFELSEPEPASRRRGGGHETALMAPMPATVRRIAVGVGDSVTPGETLLVLEAMKMELPVRSAVAGTVRAISCREGELVQPGVALIDIDALA
jgi:biotin carboxyl carrier protein